MEEVLDALIDAYSGVLGPRLVGIAAHGSSVTGDFFPGVSDLDLAVILEDRLTLADSKTIARRIDALSIEPFAYVQAMYHEAANPRPSLVPGAFRLLNGAVDEAFIHTERSLRSAATAWLEEVPALLDRDLKDWSVAVGRRPRQFRLLLTRLKPTVRAKLVRWGQDAVVTYSRPWPKLVEHLARRESNLATKLSVLLTDMDAPTLDPMILGAQVLDLLQGLAETRG